MSCFGLVLKLGLWLGLVLFDVVLDFFFGGQRTLGSACSTLVLDGLDHVYDQHLFGVCGSL